MKKMAIGLALLVAASAVHAEDNDKKSFDPVASTAQDEGFKPSFKSLEGDGQSHSRPLRTPPGFTGVYMGVWKAGPGAYRSPGARAEVFVVMEGKGKIVLEGIGEYALEPGTIISSPANTPAVLTVFEPLRKVGWVDVSRCPMGDTGGRTDC